MNESVVGELYHHILRFSFDGPGNHQYIVIAENYSNHIFAIKFFLKSHSGSDDKFGLLTGFQKAPRIIRTCIEIMLLILRDHPTASFCILGTSLENESKQETKRFRIYKHVLQNFFSPVRFEHRYMAERSLYLLINKENDIPALIEELSGLLIKYNFE